MIISLLLAISIETNEPPLCTDATLVSKANRPIELFKPDEPGQTTRLERDTFEFDGIIHGEKNGRFIIEIDGEKFEVRRRNVSLPEGSACRDVVICSLATNDKFKSEAGLGSSGC